MNFKKIKALCLSLLPILSIAQVNISISDSETNKEISNAEVFLNESSFVGKTNLKGKLEVNTKEDKQKVNLTIIADNYEILDIEVIDGQNYVLQLIPLDNTIAEVLYKARTQRAFGLKRLKDLEGTSIFAAKKNEVVLLETAIVNKASNNARQIYAQVTGLNIYDNADGGLQLNIGGRGLDPNRTTNFNTRQNGYDISADVLGYPESYYTPPAEAISEIQVLRGAASLQYGTQFGGLVNFKLNKPSKNKPIQLISRQTVGSNAMFTSFNSLSGTLGKFSYYTYFNYKQGDGFRANSEYVSRNFFTQVNYQISPKTKVSAELTYLKYIAHQAGGLTDYQFYQDANFSNRERNWFEVDWRLFNVKLEHDFNANNKLSLSLFGLDAQRNAVGFRTNRVSQPDDLSQPRDLLKSEFKNFGAEAKFITKYKLGDKKSILLVGSKYYNAKNTTIQGPGSTSMHADFNIDTSFIDSYEKQSDFTFPNENIAFFTENIFYINDKLSLTPGIRYEYIKTESKGSYQSILKDLAGNVLEKSSFEDNRIFKRDFLLYGLGVSYKPTKNIESFVNFSRNYRSMTFNDIRVNNPSSQIDENITDESGFTADIGARGQLGKVFTYDIGAFGLLYDNRIGEVLKIETQVNTSGEEVETGRLVRFRGNIGKAFIYGLESSLEWNLDKQFLADKTNYKLSWFTNLAFTKSKYIESEIANIKNREVEFIPKVNLKTGLKFGYKNILGRLQYSYLSSQFTDASNAPQDLTDNNSGITGVIPAYSIVDLSLSYKYKKFKLETGINNLLNQSYFTRRATGYPGPGIIPAEPLTFYTTLQIKID